MLRQQLAVSAPPVRVVPQQQPQQYHLVQPPPFVAVDEDLPLSPITYTNNTYVPVTAPPAPPRKTAPTTPAAA
jgi:hypothetical protein